MLLSGNVVAIGSLAYMGMGVFLSLIHIFAGQVSRNDFAALSSWVHGQRNRKDVGTVVAGRN